VVDLSSSSNEGDLIADVSRDKAFTRRPFGNLNCDVLGPPGDSKIIILNDSDEEEEMREEKAIDVEAAPSFAVRSPTTTASPMTLMAPIRVTPPIGQLADAAAVEMKPTCLRLPR
jgi:hypothetical protein